MAQRKLPKRLFKNKEVIHAYQHDRESKTSMKHMTRDHLDVLQNIEAMLIAYAREEPSVDDRVIDEALGLSRQDEGDIEDAQVHVKGLCLFLHDLRATRADVSDTIWQGALRTVQDSVRRHSSLRPGDKAYINFVSNYIK
ncbi:MAG: hypothetical protein ACLQGP_41520 [Isosphaeraceae bacterium]